jgi:hypothetical protein
MRRGIVVTTSAHTSDWLMPCLESIGSKYPVLVVRNGGGLPVEGYDTVINDWNGFELGGIARGAERFDEFVHLMDTCVIKDSSLFDRLFEIPGHVFLTEGGYHYMGKFVSDDLPFLPIVSSKAEAISHELSWLNGKARTYFKPDLPVHTHVFEEKNGRRNMVLENDFIIKWKATWSI